MSYHETFASCSEDLPEMMDYHQRTVHAEKEDEEVQNAIGLRAEQLREAELQACSQTEDVERAIGNCNVNQTENAMLDVVIHSFLLQQSSTDLIAQYNMLNSDQKRIVDKVTAAVVSAGHAIRMIASGPGGTGKSKVIDVLFKTVNSKQENYEYLLLYAHQLD